MAPLQTYILSLDQGTTSSRAVLFNQAGEVCYIAQKEYPQSYPHAGWVEQDPEEIWNTQQQVMQEVISLARIPEGEVSKRVLALGVTNQRETTIVWERESGNAIYPAIGWQDRRTTEFCMDLKKGGWESLFREKTGLRLDPYFSGTKLRWILDHVSGAMEKAIKGELCFGTIDSWLLWKLTDGKVHATDCSNASRTLLYNIHEGCWDEQLLAALKIPRALLPEVKGSSDDYGQSPEGIPITAMVGDQHAALFGQACFEPGMVKNTYGTGCFLLMQTGKKAVTSQHDLLTTIGWKLQGEVCYALEGAVFTAGAAVKWLRDGLGVINKAAECEQHALEVSDNNGVVFVPAFSGLGAPHWNDEARGALLGVTAGTNRGHICRATLEAIALQSLDLVRAMEADSGVLLAELRVDGGLTKSELLLQIQADLLEADVVVPEEQESTALGAAYLAGLYVGYWESLEEICERWRVRQRVRPSQKSVEAQKLVKQWHDALRKTIA